MENVQTQTTVLTKVAPLGSLSRSETLPALITDYSAKTSGGSTMDLFNSTLAAYLGGAPQGTFSSTTKATGEARDASGREALAFQAMAAFCVMAKPIVQAPYNNCEYLTKRWKAYTVSVGLPYFDHLTPSLKTLLEECQGWMSSQTRYKALWARALLETVPEHNPGIREQILLVWKGQGLKSCQEILSFISVPSLILAYDDVNNQAIQFKKNWEEFVARHGTWYVYATVLGYDTTTIKHNSYPDLYYCAITQALIEGKLGDSGNYKMSTVRTKVDAGTLKKLSRPIGRGMTKAPAAVVEMLSKLGLNIETSDVPRKRGRSRSRSPSSSRSQSRSPQRPKRRRL